MKALVRERENKLTEGQLSELRRLPAGRLRETAEIEMAYLGLPPERAGEYVDRVLLSALPEALREALASLPAAETSVEAADNVLKVTLRLPIG